MNPVINKFLVACITTIGVATTLLVDGLTTQEIIALIIVFAGAMGIYGIPNATRNPRP